MPELQPKTVLRKVTFTCDAPKAHTVAVVGDFNEWDPKAMPMAHVHNSTWRIRVRLTPGVHEYKYVVDGQWCCEPGVDDHCTGSCGETVDNPFGTKNRVLSVA